MVRAASGLAVVAGSARDEASAALGYGLDRGFAASLGVCLHYLWHVYKHFRPGRNQLLLGATASIGLFDPRISGEEGLLGPLWK